MTLNVAAWQEAANALFRESHKSLVDFLNGQAFKVITWAIRLTEKANRRQIERLMQSIAEERPRHGEAGAKGWVRIKREVGRGTVAELILTAYWRKHGKWPVQGATHEERIQRLVAVKVKSVGMMKAGWINALNTLRRVIYQVPESAANKARFGRNRLGGYAVPATFALRSVISVLAANEAPAYQRSHRLEMAWTGDLGDPMPVLVEGLQKSLDRAAADMQSELARRLAKDLYRFGARLGGG